MGGFRRKSLLPIYVYCDTSIAHTIYVPTGFVWPHAVIIYHVQQYEKQCHVLQ